jgi:hypothetical protein
MSKKYMSFFFFFFLILKSIEKKNHFGFKENLEGVTPTVSVENNYDDLNGLTVTDQDHSNIDLEKLSSIRTNKEDTGELDVIRPIKSSKNHKHKGDRSIAYLSFFFF